MPNKELKYCEYFNVNEKYFPCIDESAINSGVSWQATYPHEAFISLLNGAEKMLGGITNKSLWIHGAYGTGKYSKKYSLHVINYNNKNAGIIAEKTFNKSYDEMLAISDHNHPVLYLLTYRDQNCQ